MRKGIIFTLSHFYPLFIVGHLCFGDWCRRCLVMFNVMPLIVFAGLLMVWQQTSQFRLSISEKRYLGYLIVMVNVIYCYYLICLFSNAKWIANHNIQFATFLVVTGVYYIYAYKHARR